MLAHSEIIQSIVDLNPSICMPKPTSSALSRLTSAVLRFPLVDRLISKPDPVNELLVEQKNATTYKQWYEVSSRLDQLTGNNEWKRQKELQDYDYLLIENLLKEMQSARTAKDYKLLLYLIRTKWSRNVGNIGDSNLFRHSNVGTKELIEAYINECIECLNYLVDEESVDLDDRYLLGMLIQTRKNIGRTALVLSGGSTFGVSHIGVLISLLENNLLPRVISGSSAGSVIASILCSHTNEETSELLGSILSRKFDFFGSFLKDLSDSKLKSLLEKIGHFLKYGTIFDISGVRETVYGFVGDLTFREAYNRTGKILNITVSPASNHEQTRLLNYLTAPHCLIWSAVCASCSVPGIFASNSIYEKVPESNSIREWNNDQSSKYVDGSVDGDLPITKLSEMFNVDHIIAVQVNPHVSPVLQISVGHVINPSGSSDYLDSLRNVMNVCYDFASSEVIHYLQILNELNIQKNITSKLISILTQKYSGDITILPKLNVEDFKFLFSNPTPEFLLNFILKGARASWPKITIINNHCGVEFALDKQIMNLRGRIISNFSQSLTSVSNNAFNVMSPRSEAYLVTAPVLNRTKKGAEADKSHQQSGLNRQKHPHIRRHNSTGISGSASSRDSNGTSSASATPSREIVKVNRRSRKASDGAILSSPRQIQLKSDGNLVRHFLQHENYQPPSKLDFLLKSLESGSYSPQLYNNNFHDPKNYDTYNGSFHRAQSSSNFQAERKSTDPFSYKYSPPKENLLHNQFDYENFESRFSESKLDMPRVLQDTKEKANYPKLSKNNSSSNSGVGLNMLKNNTPKSGCGKTYNVAFSNSYNNSSQNMNDFYMQHENTLKSLQSPDLRRYLRRSKLDCDLANHLGKNEAEKAVDMPLKHHKLNDSFKDHSDDSECANQEIVSAQSVSGYDETKDNMLAEEVKPLRKTVSEETRSSRRDI